MYKLNKYIDTSLSPNKQYKKLDNKKNIVYKQKRVKFFHFSNIIQLFSTLITFKGNNQNLNSVIINCIFYMYIKHINIKDYFI